MTRQAKPLARILHGTADAGIPFGGLCHLLRHLGFEERIRGSHHIFTRKGIAEILNLQPKGTNAKPLITRHWLKLLTPRRKVAKF